jgi:hypothetical protein
MRFPWTRIVDALAAALGRPRDPDAALPPAVRAELERWEPSDIEYYRESGGGIAGDDAPKIPDDGQI